MHAALSQRTARTPVPASAGIGLRTVHEREFLERGPRVGWIEVHSENYFADGGRAHSALMRIRADYPLSLHGVGLSLGSTDALDATHLERLRRLVDRYEPAFVSEHLSWGSVGGLHANDLLPLPCTSEALEHLVHRIDAVHEALGRTILIENISSYFRYRMDEMPEHELLVALAERTGCRILLDVNNLFVNERNHGVSASAYIDRIPAPMVAEIHLAGHSVHLYRGVEIMVDTHDTRVRPEVWRLYEHAVGRFGRVPTLIEWDSSLPELDVLVEEAHEADRIMERADAVAA